MDAMSMLQFVEEHGIRRTSAHVLSLGAWIVGKCLRTVGQLFFDFFRDGEFGPIATELPLPEHTNKNSGHLVRCL